MKFDFRAGNPVVEAVSALVVPVGMRDGRAVLSRTGRALDERLGGELSRLMEESRFTGKAGPTLIVPTLGQLPARRIILTGTGKIEDLDAEALMGAVGAAAQAARAAGASDVVVASPDAEWGVAAASWLEAGALGAALGLYRFDAYRGSAAPQTGQDNALDSITFVDDAITADLAEQALARAAAIANGVNLARDLGNEPASMLYPESLAERATAVAAESGLAVEVLGPDALAAMGAEATLAVGGGSVHPPCLIRLRYDPSSPPTDSRIAGLVGKAITFDTGGYSIKPYEGMLEMKGDMAGGAAVLGAMSALRDLDCRIPVEATICAAENMISGTAFRPGDILMGMNGVTMEILSTDAEGRLVLADGLVDTARRGATELIDLATLTGAAVVALGDGTTALFASDDELAAKLLEASRETGERMWRMPLIDALERKIEGDVGDIKNTGGRAGGAITAALFLRHFREGLPWAHLDIAGSSRQDKADALGPKGATGVGVRTLLQYLTGA